MTNALQNLSLVEVEKVVLASPAQEGALKPTKACSSAGPASKQRPTVPSSKLATTSC